MFIRASVLVAAAGLVAASPLLTPRSCGEGTQKICYGIDGGESQELNPDDIQYVAEYLRYIGEEAEGADKFWNMPKGFDCPEWGLPVDGAGSVLALAKHNNPRYPTSVLYEDLAAAIDKMSPNVGSCGKNGGQIGVVANTSNPLYNTDDYKQSGARPDGIVLKLVKAPKSS